MNYFNIDFKVSVRCFTFNHSEYIIDTLNGFCAQQTTFPYICSIVDDASTDGEQEIIKKYIGDYFEPSTIYFEDTEYANIVLASHKVNKHCFFAVILLKYNHYSINKDTFSYMSKWRDKCKYEAVCEGDDYWIGSRKLQMQYDFMESHIEYSMCFHNAIVENLKYKKGYLFNNIRLPEVISTSYLLKSKWITPTASFFHKLSVRYPLIDGINGDMLILYSCSFEGLIHYEDEIMCVYRYSTGSSLSKTSSKSSLYDKKINLYRWIDNKSNKKYCFLIQLQILKSKLAKYIRS